MTRLLVPNDGVGGRRIIARQRHGAETNFAAHPAGNGFCICPDFPRHSLPAILFATAFPMSRFRRNGAQAIPDQTLIS